MFRIFSVIATALSTNYVIIYFYILPINMGAVLTKLNQLYISGIKNVRNSLKRSPLIRILIKRWVSCIAATGCYQETLIRCLKSPVLCIHECALDPIYTRWCRKALHLHGSDWIRTFLGVRYKRQFIWVGTCIGAVGTDPNGQDSEKPLLTPTLCTHVPIVINFAHAPHDGSELDYYRIQKVRTQLDPSFFSRVNRAVI